MSTLIIFIFTLISFPLWSQESQDQIQEKMKELDNKSLSFIEKENQKKEELKTRQNEVEELSLEKVRLNEMNEKREVLKEMILSEVNAEIKGSSIFKKVLSPRVAFYRCLRDSLENQSFADITSCSRSHSIKMKDEDRVKIQVWEKQLGLSSAQVKSKLSSFESKHKLAVLLVQSTESDIRYIQREQDDLKKQKSELILKQQELNFYETKKEFFACDENSPTINLEEKAPYPSAEFDGPFYKVPRDNQDGVGSCFANAAKNMLVSLSKGKDIASFLDMALLYKKTEKRNLTELDGGLSCYTLAEVVKYGYCPQQFSPIETGESHPLVEGLIPSGSSDVYGQLGTLHALKNFLVNKPVIDDPKSSLHYVSQNAKAIIDEIKANPSLKIPLPVLRFNIPERWLIEQTYNWPKNGKKFEIKKEDFLAEYDNEYQKFYPEMVKALVQGKNLDQILEMYQKALGRFAEKYGIQEDMEKYKRNFKQDAEPDFKSPTFKKDLHASLDFLKKMLGKETESTENFVMNCVDNDFQKGSNFLINMQALLTHLTTKKLGTESLVDDKGQFRSAADLLQLAIAPSCLNSENRKKLDFEFTCDSGYSFISDIKKSQKTPEEKTQMIRKRIVSQLLKGYSLGNTFERHINSIVGIRFNKETKRCEYNIRESQTGTSRWHDENIIISKIEALTVVNRK